MEDSTKLRIFNVTATVFNLRQFTLEEVQDADSGNPNLVTLTALLDSALDMAMREYDWSFLLTELDMGEDLGPMGGFPHSYQLPENLFRVVSLPNEKVYQRFGNRILTNNEKAPLVIGMTLDFDDSVVPRDFWDLVGYGLAILAGNSIVAGDSKLTTASTAYTKIAQNLMLNDSQNESRLVYENGEEAWHRS